MQCAFSEGPSSLPSSKGREDIGEDTKSDTPSLSLSLRLCFTPVVTAVQCSVGTVARQRTAALPAYVPKYIYTF